MRTQASLQRLETQIAKLQGRADVIRAKEKEPIVQAILDAIRHYRISPEDLGISAHSRGPWKSLAQRSVHSMPGPAYTEGVSRRNTGIVRPGRLGVVGAGPHVG
jgi:hypothetical protein